MLAIIKYLKEHGLAKAVEDFKLKVREYDNKILLKYDQLESNMALPEVQDCRGLILEKGTWDIMAMSFRKFFNDAEGFAAKIDWSTANILEKLDGTMIAVYYDWHKKEWFAATTGTAEGEGEVNNKMNTTFNDLFWETAYKFNKDIKNTFSKEGTYIFELTTPYNIVVKPHGTSTITLIAVRNNLTLEELNYEHLKVVAAQSNVPLVKSYDLNNPSIASLMETFQDMIWHDEGYVVIDANFNRVKIKNPAYVAVHHLKSKLAEYHIITIVKTNEIDEFISTFPDRKDELLSLKANYDILIARLETAWAEIKPFLPKDASPVEKKEYAMKVFEVTANHDLKRFTGLYFTLQTGKVASVREYMLDFDDKELYKML